MKNLALLLRGETKRMAAAPAGCLALVTTGQAQIPAAETELAVHVLRRVQFGVAIEDYIHLVLPATIPQPNRISNWVDAQPNSVVPDNFELGQMWALYNAPVVGTLSAGAVPLQTAVNWTRDALAARQKKSASKSSAHRSSGSRALPGSSPEHLIRGPSLTSTSAAAAARAVGAYRFSRSSAPPPTLCSCP